MAFNQIFEVGKILELLIVFLRNLLMALIGSFLTRYQVTENIPF